MPQDVPHRYRDAVVAHVMVDGAAAAIDFYAQAFAADELFRIADQNGTILHAEITISGSLVMVGDADAPFAAPRALGSSTVGLHVYVDDVDAAFDRAVAAGADVVQPVQDMFYGARVGMVKDPFGHQWVLLTQQEDLSEGEIMRRGEQLLAG